MRFKLFAFFALSTLTGGMPALAQSNDAPIIRYEDLTHPVFGASGMVAAQNRLSAQVGADVLADGGNAVDAAVAVGFSLAVTLPRAGNLGGGGFMLIHDTSRNESTSIDYREMAPLLATRDMYLDENGDVDPVRSKFRHTASGIPGTVAGLYLAHQKYGRLPWKRLLKPAIKQAHDGIVVSYDFAQLLKARKQRLCGNAAACGYFYKRGGVPYEPGEIFRQRDLARTLRLIARHGPDAFYRGEIADLIDAEMRRGGGLVDKASLAAYRPIEREVVRGNYRGYDIVTMPPPSSGGVHLLQMLNTLENLPVAEQGAGSAANVHLLS